MAGIILFLFGSFLRTLPVSGAGSSFVQFMDGLLSDISIGSMLVGIIWAVYGFAKTHPDQ